MKDENNMAILINAERALDTTQHPFMVKIKIKIKTNTQQTRVEGKFLNLVKDI